MKPFGWGLNSICSLCKPGRGHMRILGDYGHQEEWPQEETAHGCLHHGPPASGTVSRYSSDVQGPGRHSKPGRLTQSSEVTRYRHRLPVFLQELFLWTQLCWARAYVTLRTHFWGRITPTLL